MLTLSLSHFILDKNLQAADAMEDVVCAVTSSDAVFKLFNVESDAAVVVLKKFDDLRSVKKIPC